MTYIKEYYKTLLKLYVFPYPIVFTDWKMVSIAQKRENPIHGPFHSA